MNIYRSIRILLILILFGSFTSQAKIYHVSTFTELESVIISLLPGDTVLLAAKEWNNVTLTFKGEGTPEAPIVFGAEVPGQTFLTGSSRIQISGKWLVVRDFIFKDGNISNSCSIVEFRTDSDELAYNCRLTNVSILSYNPTNKDIDTKYVSLYGTNNRVDHCTLLGKTNSGATLVVWLDETPDYHLIDHNYFGPREDLGYNGGETIRIGTSDWERYNSNCIVEYNLFEECDGEIEIISNKSVGNHYRYNTFDRCEGTLTLRHGSDCWVYGNFFFGDLSKDCGGIRIIGPGHRVFNNYLENLNGTSYRAAISLVNGIPDSPANGYRQVDDARVGYNTIINCKEPFAIGAGVDEEKTLPPINSYIENNLIVARSGLDLVKDYASTDGVSWKGNIHNADKIGITADGFIKAELPMINDGTLYRPDDGNPAIGAALNGVFDTITVDIDGQSRPLNGKDIGCDQVSNNPVVIKPLTNKDVGAHYDSSTYADKILLPKHIIKIEDGVAKLYFERTDSYMVSFYSMMGQELSKKAVSGNFYVQNIVSYPPVFVVDIRSSNSRYVTKIINNSF
ncbi:polysaccharide lyase 6 family protein [Tenuifilum thalassicum]|uniref:Alginate lyase n=1 Tax=Tenuifilum thalassicum TaxID=2590900 RepID=A0A7D4BD73_9BACT|nr:polysaccharide lyase 6 family protein [Tenuifilum thalassicum]QKG79463.1 hypothetical protein FHG85_04000 [Tenuifilum thalassicum]